MTLFSVENWREWYGVYVWIKHKNETHDKRTDDFCPWPCCVHADKKNCCLTIDPIPCGGWSWVAWLHLLVSPTNPPVSFTPSPTLTLSLPISHSFFPFSPSHPFSVSPDVTELFNCWPCTQPRVVHGAMASRLQFSAIISVSGVIFAYAAFQAIYFILLYYD